MAAAALGKNRNHAHLMWHGWDKPTYFLYYTRIFGPQNKINTHKKLIAKSELKRMNDAAAAAVCM